MSEITVFAKIAGSSNVAVYDHNLAMREFNKKDDEVDPRTNVLRSSPADASHANLPELTQSQVEDVTDAIFYSGAYADVAALVLARKGANEFQSYCEFQSYAGMREDYLKAPDAERKWWFSGLVIPTVLVPPAVATDKPMPA